MFYFQLTWPHYIIKWSNQLGAFFSRTQKSIILNIFHGRSNAPAQQLAEFFLEKSPEDVLRPMNNPNKLYRFLSWSFQVKSPPLKPYKFPVVSKFFSYFLTGWGIVPLGCFVKFFHKSMHLNSFCPFLLVIKLRKAIPVINSKIGAQIIK